MKVRDYIENEKADGTTYKWVKTVGELGNGIEIELTSYYFVTIRQEGYGGLSLHTKSSQIAKKFFGGEIKKCRYTDYGDCFYDFDGEIWRVFGKPSKENIPEEYRENWIGNKILYKIYGKLLLKMHKKEFPRIIKFLEKEQVQEKHFGINDESVWKRYQYRKRKEKLEKCLK